MNYRQTLDYLYSQLPMFQRIGAAAYKADLQNTLELCRIMGNPENKFRSVHIAGTNGKGSVSHLISSVMQEAGYRTGLYTSPHMRDFRERVRVNGKKVPVSFVTGFVNDQKVSFEAIRPSFFEYTVCLAFDHFAHEKVDIAILETGMGGRLDSTNVVTPLISVITNISKDHTAFLGETLDKIAFEKAGIIKPGVPVIIGERQPGPDAVFIEKARLEGSPIQFSSDRWRAEIIGTSEQKRYLKLNVFLEEKLVFEGLECPLKGTYQRKNILTAVNTLIELRKLGYNIPDPAVHRGISNVIRNTGLSGRWQVIGRKPKVICDVGHNEAGIVEIIEQLGMEKYTKLHWVLGMVGDKDAAGILKLLPTHATYYFCKPAIPRGLDSEILRIQAYEFGLKGRAYRSVTEAYSKALEMAGRDDLVLVAGSTFVVAEVI